ncbi:L-threonine 3-dehydrogenase [Arenibacter antarcticus]|uniref:NAD(P)-dependent alcohol dehydrogenase n=1 Tax=Arenibacter antarcticus TaxID=2040469 RepID=A0ABW5VJS0_9FLAO|nr:NAD(P)-dependent alcohol dehydrogenase [Arenibacter sp. H213]MCM4166357.1 NAD(P)-dependent alcohol dehydrogenase [Arenibacter sp. H213]
MKAVITTKYGPPEVLKIHKVNKPAPKDHEILLRVYATAVTSGDARIRGMNIPFGFEFISRLMFGFNKPRNPILGGIFAGEIEAIGAKVKMFNKGDMVFGATESFGCYADYVVVPERGAIVKKPANISFDEAAAIPFGALTSLKFLRDFGKIKADQKVLVNGASGDLGTFAIQLAKYYGAKVTGICSTKNRDLVTSLGADDVIDYTKSNFTKSNTQYDLIFDTLGNLSFSSCRSSLTPKGTFLTAVAKLHYFFIMPLTALKGNKKLKTGVALFNKQDLQFIVDLLEQGKIIPVIDRKYRVTEITAAHRYVDEGHKVGSVVITLKHDYKLSME